jgi:hypothetical protein
MIDGSCPGRSIGKICYFALIGFLTIILAGPALGLLSLLLSLFLAIFSAAVTVFVVILPFAVLGFVIVAPIKAVTTGRPIQWNRLGAWCHELWRGILRVAWWCWRKLVGFLHFFRSKVALLTIYLRGAVIWEALCGAAVGGFLGGMLTLGDPDKPEIIIGAVLGAVLGALVGISRMDLKKPAIAAPKEPAQ